MPFGLCNAPATFERLMEQVLIGLPVSVALVYLDDILVPAHTFSQQIAHLRMVFARLANAKLKLSPGKCALFQTRVKYLGHVVDAEGISPDPDKVDAVKSWPKPATATEVKRLLFSRTQLQMCYSCSIQTQVVLELELCSHKFLQQMAKRE